MLIKWSFGEIGFMSLKSLKEKNIYIIHTKLSKEVKITNALTGHIDHKNSQVLL